MGRIQYHQQTGLKKMSCWWTFKHIHQLLLLCMLNSKIRFILISIIFKSSGIPFMSKDFHPSFFPKEVKTDYNRNYNLFSYPTQCHPVIRGSDSGPQECKKSPFLICLSWEKDLSRFVHTVFKNKQQLFIKYPLGPWHFKTEILWQIFKETEVPRKISPLTQ